MTGGEIAALVASLAFVALVVFASVMLARMHATLTTVQSLVTDLHRSTVPLLEQLTETASGVNVEIDRVDGILASAESVANSASNVAGLVSTAVSNPLIRAVAFLAGAGAAARRIRKGRRR